MNARRHMVACSLVAICLVLLARTAWSDPPQEAPASATPQKPVDDWARKHLSIDDPLASRPKLSLADLDQALADPVLQRTVVKHVARAEVTDKQATEFLVRALRCNSPAVQRDAAVELASRGTLIEIVQKMLWELAQSDDESVRETVVLALDSNHTPYERVPEEYWNSVVAALQSNDARVQLAATRQLERWGAASIPLLLDALRSEQPGLRRAAAEVLSRVLATLAAREQPGEATDTPKVDRQMPQDQLAAPPPKFVPPQPLGLSVRTLDSQASTAVTVYFATNRAKVGIGPPWWKLVLGTIGGVFGIALVARQRSLPAVAENLPRDRWRRRMLFACGLLLSGTSLIIGNEAVRGVWAPQSQSPFSNQRDAQDRIHYGLCVVSIPPSHIEGNLEEPIIGVERESEHVVLKQTELREEQAFFEEVRSVVQRDLLSPQDCLVFVHGYNVTFDKAARRTAQIHFDLKFPGVPLFFSWPSRGNPAEYSWDREEVEKRSYRDIQKFLVDVARRTGAARVHVLAHSMGAEAVTKAIRELGEEGTIFDQVILAAPDIDRQVFHDEIAPRLNRHSRRTTLYCSKNDRALFLSRYWNSWGDPAPRAGDSTDGPLLAVGTDTIDASTIRTDLLGHSYYGDCVPLLHDVGLLLRERLPPDKRKLEPRVFDDAAPSDPRRYWMLHETDFSKKQSDVSSTNRFH